MWKYILDVSMSVEFYYWLIRSYIGGRTGIFGGERCRGIIKYIYYGIFEWNWVRVRATVYQSWYNAYWVIFAETYFLISAIVLMITDLYLLRRIIKLYLSY